LSTLAPAVDPEGGRVVDRASVRNNEAVAQPAQRRAPDADAMIDALVRLLARQAAREHLHRLAHPEADTTDDN
jgi:hypothetical protein